MKSGIYKITIGPKYYFGQSLDVSMRKNQHTSKLFRDMHYNVYMQNAYNKYQEFKFEVVLYCDADNLDMYEQIFLDKYVGEKDCMNILANAYSSKGYKHTDETRAKMSKIQTGRKHTEETKAKMRKIATGRPVSEEARRKISETKRSQNKKMTKSETKHLRKRVKAVLPDGTIKYWDSAKEAQDDLGFWVQGYCTGKTPQPGTGKLKYKKNAAIHGWVFSYVPHDD